MKFVQLKRTVRSGFLNFSRNGIVSLASVLVMTITLSVFAGTILFQRILSNTLTSVENRVDISVYFVPGADETAITDLQSQVNALPQVASTQYISEHDALAAFRARHENDQTTLQALDELDQNPIGAMLDIQAKDISQYGAISNFFDNSTALSAGSQSIIDHVDYNNNQAEIAAIQNIMNKGTLLGYIIIGILVLLSIIITFNTIRLAIYFSREEISVMRLVGASRAQVQGPFVIEGVFYGVIATIFALALFIPVTAWFGARMTSFLGINIFHYYTSNLLWFFLILLAFGLVLGVVSSFLAARKYLKV